MFLHTSGAPWCHRRVFLNTSGLACYSCASPGVAAAPVAKRAAAPVAEGAAAPVAGGAAAVAKGLATHPAASLQALLLT